MRFPGYLKRHSVTVEPYLGTGAYGPNYGPAVTVRCFQDRDAKLIKTPEGDEVMSSAIIYCEFTENIPINSRITLSTGDKFHAIAVRRNDGGGLPTFDHLEVTI